MHIIHCGSVVGSFLVRQKRKRNVLQNKFACIRDCLTSNGAVLSMVVSLWYTLRSVHELRLPADTR